MFSSCCQSFSVSLIVHGQDYQEAEHEIYVLQPEIYNFNTSTWESIPGFGATVEFDEYDIVNQLFQGTYLGESSNLVKYQTTAKTVSSVFNGALDAYSTSCIPAIALKISLISGGDGAGTMGDIDYFVALGLSSVLQNGVAYVEFWSETLVETKVFDLNFN
jgi:hypothetical protein